MTTTSPDTGAARDAGRSELVAKDSPREYLLDEPSEIVRLYRETRGYLHTCHHKHGTDWEGRKFAIDALDALIALSRSGAAT